MADLGHQMTDEMLEQLEKKIAREYALASKEMRKKLRDYLEKDEEKRLEQKALLDAGKISRKEYREWCYRHKMMGQQWRDMKNVLAEDLQNARAIATKIARDQMADVYALNANYAAYQLEHDFGIDTGFTLYNHDTAALLMREENLQLMPAPSSKKAAEIAADKALQWDMQRIQSAVLQGVLQGESPFDVAKRLRGVAQMDYNASVRYARTMTTSAQNAGRYEAYRRADKLGVKLTIEWQATLDGRTRHDHRLMHGQRRNVDEPFKLPSGQEILYPADSRGNSYELQGEIWNCRCTLLSWVKGFEGDTVKESPKMGDMSFEEWLGEKAKEKAEEAPSFANAFGNSAITRWRSWRNEEEDPTGEKQETIEKTLARLQENYPMQSAKEWEYKSTLDSLDICDYKDSWLFLPEGENDPRFDDDYGVLGQVFNIFDKASNTDRAVLGINRDLLSETLEEVVERRQKTIAAGREVFSLAGFNAETVTTHEWGHIFSEHISTAMINGSPIADEYYAWYKSLGKDAIRSGISYYAGENRSEFEAECFLEMQMPNPRPIALKWWEYMQKVIAAGY